MKQVRYSGSTDIRRHRTKFSRKSGLASELCALQCCTAMIMKCFVAWDVTSRRVEIYVCYSDRTVSSHHATLWHIL